MLTAARCAESGHVAARFASGEVIPLEVVETEHDGVVLFRPGVELPSSVTPLRLLDDDSEMEQVTPGLTATLAGFGVTETQSIRRPALRRRADHLGQLGQD